MLGMLRTPNQRYLSPQYSDVLRARPTVPYSHKRLFPFVIFEWSIYLGSTFKKVTHRSGSQTWASSSDKYVKEAVEVAFNRSKAMGIKLQLCAKSPTSPFSNIKYLSELDVTTLCNVAEYQFYQQLIETARWMIEMGRLDINVEISLLSRYMAAPRVGHLTQLLHIFHYLHSHRCMELTFDPTKINVNESTILPHQRAKFKATTMCQLYPDFIDYLPPNAPEPLVKIVQLNAFVDADLAN